MFNMGLSEILIVLAVALVFVGPAKIPEIARTIGRGIGKLRRASDEVRDTIQSEIDSLDRDEIQKKIATEKEKGIEPASGAYSGDDPYIREAASQPDGESGAGAEREDEPPRHKERQGREITSSDLGAHGGLAVEFPAACADAGAVAGANGRLVEVAREFARIRYYARFLGEVADDE